ncbi:MalY/PatB family protein [Paenibacillus agilis]|uniref:cysteine-S-conjugate beta-lyase n=1 Tax=Paenibacillus agilis TaxID=3020863 RepID=A0A559IQ63_9BACL|nr:MalY/PatB family protein [Paenibacillus agilis]TVX89784.1 pyridoxal phosphate-dependent aminotransferase [Paenibacillus agilis]
MYEFDRIIDRVHTDASKVIPQSAAHKDCIPLWVADMDFEAAPAIQEAIVKRLQTPIYGYTERSDRYYDAVIGWMNKRHHWQIKKDWIVTIPGVVPAMAVTMRTWVKPGEKAIILPPLYPPFASMIASNGGTVVTSPLVLQNGHYEIDFYDFEQKAKDPAVKMFFLCNPHNPGGRVWSREELQRIAGICLANDVLIFSDDIHHDIVFPGHTYTPIASLSPEVADITITATSAGKSFNIAGFKAANIMISNAKLRNAFRRTVQALGMNDLDVMPIEATIAAYTEGEAWFEAMMEYIQGNNKLIEEFITARIPEVKVFEQEGTYLKWLDFRELGLSPDELKDFLQLKAKVWLNQGISFGENGAGFMRLNMASPRSVIQEALERMEKAIRERR